MKIKKDDAKKASAVNACDFLGQMSPSYFEFTKYLQKFILKKTAILLRFQFSRFSAIYKTPIVI